MTRLKEGERHYGVHMSHCNMGENFRSCCYGEPDICPALEGMLPDPDPKYVVQTLTHMAEQMEALYPDYVNNIYRQAIILIAYHGHYHDY